MRYLLSSLLLLLSITANAEPYSYVQYSDEVTIAIVADKCELATSDKLDLRKSYAISRVSGQTLLAGCWYHDGEIIHVVFPPSGDQEAIDLPYMANKFKNVVEPTL